jgi:hypothetical protein
MGRLPISYLIEPLNQDIEDSRKEFSKIIYDKSVNRNKLVEDYFNQHVVGKYVKRKGSFLKVISATFNNGEDDNVDYFILNVDLIHIGENFILEDYSYTISYTDISELSFISKEEYDEEYNKALSNMNQRFK